MGYGVRLWEKGIFGAGKEDINDEIVQKCSADHKNKAMHDKGQFGNQQSQQTTI
jgi:hypothetical protein